MLSPAEKGRISPSALRSSGSRPRPCASAAAGLASVTARPGALMIVLVLVLVIFWMIGDYAAERAGVTALEEAPFPELGLILTVIALLVALLILTTQRHEQALAEKRSQLTLQIAILSERKTARLIGMLDDLRIALPSVPSHRDPEAEEMAKPADPIATMELIEAQVDSGDVSTAVQHPEA